jgi:hypothetical protein
MARSSQPACHAVLTERRVGMVPARRSTALRLIRMSRIHPKSRGMPGLRGKVTEGCGAITGREAGVVPYRVVRVGVAMLK